MKRLKKLLILVLALSLLYASLTINAFAYNDIGSTHKNAVAINTLTRLGVFQGDNNGNFNPESQLKRAEACAIITRIMTNSFEVEDAYRGATNFNDVSKSFWGEPYISYCAQNGIVMGGRNGSFRPNDTVTDAEFVAMITRVLGYDTQDNRLVYPIQNIYVAEKIGLLDGVYLDTFKPATRENVAQIVYNALFVNAPRYAVTTSGKTVDRTTAEAVFGLRHVTATLVSTPYDSVSGYPLCEENHVMLSDYPQKAAVKPQDDSKSDADAASPTSENELPAGELTGSGTYYYPDLISSDVGSSVDVWFYNTDNSEDVTIDSAVYATLTDRDVVQAIVPIK